MSHIHVYNVLLNNKKVKCLQGVLKELHTEFLYTQHI
jgi:hypothetical protein